MFPLRDYFVMNAYFSAILYKRETVVNRYQLKEAEFDQEVKEDLQAERRNELRW